MDAAKVTGIWTQHVDAASGRTYYFNMAHGRSYWELPAELLAQVHKPLIETKRQWDPETNSSGQAAVEQTGNEGDEQRRKREEVLAAMAQEEAQSKSGAGSTMDALQVRMAHAAQRKKADEVKRSSQQPSEAEAAPQDEYLAMVRQLQDVDKDSGESGGKWLVR